MTGERFKGRRVNEDGNAQNRLNIMKGVLCTNDGNGCAASYD